jgi:hypothetical protein
MPNMRITSILATRYRQLQVEMQDGIAHSVVEDELNDIQAPPKQLRNKVIERARAELSTKPQLALGDRVKLTERGVRLWRRQAGIDWPNRRGTVRHITKHSEAHVQWDGRKSTEVLAVVILERCNSPTSEDV